MADFHIFSALRKVIDFSKAQRALESMWNNPAFQKTAGAVIVGGVLWQLSNMLSEWSYNNYSTARP